MHSRPPLPSAPAHRSSTSGRGGLFFVLGLMSLLLFPPPLFGATASSTLPYGGLIDAATVRAIARASAYLAALPLAAEELQKHKAASLGAREAAKREALAAAVHRPVVTVNPASDALPSTGTVRVDVTLSTPQRTLDARVRTALPRQDMLFMREELLRSMRQASDEARDLALRAADMLSRGHKEEQHILDQRLIWLGSRLKALWLVDEALVSFQGTWIEPAKVQKLLRKAVELDGRNELAWAALGEVQLQLDQPLNALESLRSSLKLQAEQPRALYARGLAHLRLQQPALAEADLTAALRLAPDNAAWLRARGAARMVREDYGPMCEDFERACALGDCAGLMAARKRELCLSPVSAPLPPTPLLSAPASDEPQP